MNGLNGESGMHDCLVRKMHEEDLTVVSGMYKNMYDEQKKLGMVYSLRDDEADSFLTAQLKSRLHFLYVLVCGGTIKGFASGGLIKLQRKYKLGDEDFIGFIHDLYVEPDQRGKGYAQKLLSAVESELRAAGISHIELHVVQGNECGIRFWSKNGFAGMMQVMYKSIKEE